MVNAIVLFKAEPRKINEAAQKLMRMPCVSEVYAVGGRFDLAAVLRAKKNEDISTVVTENFLEVDGVLSSETLIAFRTYSRYDLEKLFSLERE
ncbi:MAG: hypothetical protein PWQ57_112 [Desulfovibrionales bacterium]|jgi:DNA-binding Lrp family transcriptional regulator|nr:hypothetical protein [Desulfovibrionales bacterium]